MKSELQGLHLKVRLLYEARQGALKAKKLRSELASKLGNCCEADENQTACHLGRNPKEKWCYICKAKLPAWEDYRKKSYASGSALRDVLREGKQMVPSPRFATLANEE